MVYKSHSTEFIKYLLNHARENPFDPQLPSLNQLSRLLQISVSRLREQVEVAKSMGFVEVRPRTGIKRLNYEFYPSVWQSLLYGIELTPELFDVFSDLRKKMELAYWNEAVYSLEQDNIENLQGIVNRAFIKLRGSPIRVPHEEHRTFHLSIYQGLENPFLIGIIKAYWDAYEELGLSFYTHIDYLEEVWGYHQKMVDAIKSGNIEEGYRVLAEHTDLLRHRLD